MSKAPNPQLLHGRRSINGCPLFQVCVCVCSRCVYSLLCVCTLDGLNVEHKFRVWVTIFGRMSRHFHFSLSNIICYIRSERLGNCWGKHWMCNIILDLCITLCFNIVH